MPALDLNLLGKHGASLEYWLSPYINHLNHEIGDGDLLPEWLDCSGLRNTAAAQADVTHQPTLYVDDGARGLWAVDFQADAEGGTYQVLEGPDADVIFPNNTKSLFVSFKPGAGNGGVATKQVMAGESGDKFLMGIEDGKMRARTVNGGVTQFLVGPPPVPGPSPDPLAPDLLLVEDEWYIGIVAVGAGKLWGSVNDPINMTSLSCGNTAGLQEITIGAAGISDPYTGRIGEVLCFSTFLLPFERGVVYNYLAANWLPRGDTLENAREPGSRRFVFFGLNRLKATADLPLEYTDREMLDAVHVAHPLGVDPRAQGGGWPYDDSRPMRIAAMQEDMDAQVIRATLADMRIATSFWNSCDHLRSGDPRREGQAVIGRGARNFSRVTPGWTKQPGGIVIQAASMTELVEDQGIVAEAFSTNQLQRSSVISGFTGVPKTGDGVNGSDITLGAAMPLLFDFTNSKSYPGATSQSWDFLAGNPHTSDLYLSQPTIVSANVPANSVYGFSVDHLTVTVGMLGKLAWRLQRSVDSFYWDDLAQAWTATLTWNEVENTASDLIIERAYFGGIDTGASATDLTLDFGLPSGGDASRMCRVYHVQLEQGTAFPGSRIVTNGAFVDRSETRLWFYNGSPAIPAPFPNDCGTFLCRFVPLWTTAEGQVESSDFHLFVARHTTDPVAAGLINCYRMFYTSDDEEFLFAANDGTSDWATAFPHTVTRLTEIKAAARWISLSRDQVGYAAGTMSVFINGAKGAVDAVRTANPPLSVDSQIWAANTPRGRQICGWLLDWKIVPEPWTDREIYRWSQG
jgi:hypothetical protein